MLRKLFIGIAAICLIGLGYFLAVTWETVDKKKAQMPGGQAYSQGGGPPGGATSKPRIPTVEVAQVIQRDLRARVVGNGIVRPVRRVDILARVEGLIESLGVEAGDDVTTKTELCQIDERALSLAVTTASIEFKEADNALKAMVQLRERNAATQQEYEASLFRFQRSEATLAETKLRLSYAKPSGPFAGVVTQRHVEIGQQVRVGDLLFSVADFTPLQMQLYLAEKDVLDVEVGQDVELRREAEGGRLATGKVERISRVVDRESLTVEVILEFDYDADAVGLRPGSFARVDIVTQRFPGSLVVPRSAVRMDEEGQPYVFRVERSGAPSKKGTPEALEAGAAAKLEKIPVTWSFDDGRIYSVQMRRDPKAGYDDSRPPLAAGDRIVVQGNRQLRSGTTVKIYRELDVAVDPLTLAPPPPG